MTEFSGRLHALDNLRAVAMLLGIVLHGAVSLMVMPMLWPVHDVSRSLGFDALLGLIHGFRMHLFFFLAGFFGHLLWQRRGPRDFLRQRWRRIGIPFAVGMVTVVPLMMALWYWADARTGADYTRQQSANASLWTYPTGHLWFLEMLLFLYLLVALLAWGGQRLAPQGNGGLAGEARAGGALAGGALAGGALLARADRAFDALMQQPFKPLLLMLPTAALLWNGPMFGEIDIAGQRLLPPLRAVAYYGLFFAMGWWLHRRPAQLESLKRWNRSYLAVALVSFLTLGYCLGLRLRPDAANYTTIKLLALSASALYAWTMSFALTGLFLRFAARQRPWMSYLADASYWWYLCHLPIVMVLQVLIADWPVNGWLKLLLILSATVAVLLPSYHWGVRHTAIGRLLNGPR